MLFAVTRVVVLFSETRWAKVGVCGRRYIASLCGGIDRLHEICMGDPHITKYHLSGYSKADKRARSLLCTAAYSALPSESLLLELFEDDRYLRSSEAVWNAVTAEVSYLVGSSDVRVESHHQHSWSRDEGRCISRAGVAFDPHQCWHKGIVGTFESLATVVDTRGYAAEARRVESC